MIVIATAAPGPNILVIILTQIQSGYHGVLWAIGGNLSANALITLFAVLGSHTLIEAGGPLLLFIYAMIGGLFLCFLGFQTLSGAIESGRRLTEKTKALSANRENGTGEWHKRRTCIPDNIYEPEGDPLSIRYITAILRFRCAYRPAIFRDDGNDLHIGAGDPQCIRAIRGESAIGLWLLKE